MYQILEIKTADELFAHYKAVRDRLNPPPRVVLEEPKPEPEPELEPKPVIEVKPEPKKEPPKVSIMRSTSIFMEASEKYKMSIKMIKSTSRRKKFVEVRQEVAYRLRMELKYSYPQIGRLLGNRDHTTAINAVKGYEKKLAKIAEIEASQLNP